MAPDVRLVSVPAGHPYPRAVHALLRPGLTVLDDPDPDCWDRPATGRWWPHPGLEPAWLATQSFDVLHLNFGFDHVNPAELGELAAFLRASGRALVLTVHDLRSPHQVDPTILDSQLDVLVPAADALLTLTPWAADRLQRRWGRQALVVAHPPLVASDASRKLRAERAGRRPARPVVALACKSLRPNTDPTRLLPALQEATRRHDAQLRVLVHTEVLSHPTSDARRALAQALATARSEGVDVVAHEPMTDTQLWAELASQDVAVLPYRFGSHSGWLEVCHDVGTHVAAPSFGGYADQGADGTYRADEHTIDEDSLIACVGELVDRARAGHLAGDEADVQQARSASVAAVHEWVYDDVLARAAVSA